MVLFCTLYLVVTLAVIVYMFVDEYQLSRDAAAFDVKQRNWERLYAHLWAQTKGVHIVVMLS